MRHPVFRPLSIDIAAQALLIVALGEWINLRNFRSGKGLQAVVDLSKSGDGLTIHFDTLQPYIGWVCFSRYLAYFKFAKEGSWKLHPELSEVGIEQ